MGELVLREALLLRIIRPLFSTLILSNSNKSTMLKPIWSMTKIPLSPPSGRIPNRSRRPNLNSSSNNSSRTFVNNSATNYSLKAYKWVIIHTDTPR